MYFNDGGNWQKQNADLDQPYSSFEESNKTTANDDDQRVWPYTQPTGRPPVTGQPQWWHHQQGGQTPSQTPSTGPQHGQGMPGTQPSGYPGMHGGWGDGMGGMGHYGWQGHHYGWQHGYPGTYPHGYGYPGMPGMYGVPGMPGMPGGWTQPGWHGTSMGTSGR